MELIAGITRITSDGTPQMLLRRYTALSKLPLKRRAEVRNRFPTLADVKSKVDDGGLARLRISMFKRLKNERINSFFAGVTNFHISEVPLTIEYHSSCASEACVERRWLKIALMADRSEFGGESGIRRTSLPRFSRQSRDAHQKKKKKGRRQ